MGCSSAVMLSLNAMHESRSVIPHKRAQPIIWLELVCGVQDKPKQLTKAAKINACAVQLVLQSTADQLMQ